MFCDSVMPEAFNPPLRHHKGAGLHRLVVGACWAVEGGLWTSFGWTQVSSSFAPLSGHPG